MYLIWTVVIGVVAGLMAKDFSPGKEPSGFSLTVLLGVVGAVLGVYAGQWAGWYKGGQALGFVAAIIGASTLLSIFNIVRRMRAR